MTLLSLLVVLLLEQVRPIRQANQVEAWVDQRLRRVMAAESDRRASAWLAWALVVGGAALLSLLLVKLLGLIHPLFEFLATAGLLYLTMGFRRFSHWFHEIQEALRLDDLASARGLLAKWVDESRADSVARAAAEQGDASAVARESIRLALIAAQRHVFGVIFWFVVLPGAAGAIAYWLSGRLLVAWARDAQRPAFDEVEAAAGLPVLVTPTPVLFGSDAGQGSSMAAEPQPPVFSQVACLAYRWIDWLPVRVTAIIFAIVGNFEDSISMWRARAAAAPESHDDTDRILVASGAGAMGVRLSIPDAPIGSPDSEDSADLGAPSSDEPDLREALLGSMDTAVGLVWRSIVMWFFMVLLFYLGSWLA